MAKEWLYEYTLVERKGEEKDSIFYAIKKPNRRIRENADDYYAAQVGKNAKKGMILRAVLATIIANSEGMASADEKETYYQSQKRIQEIAEYEIPKFGLKQESELTEEDKKHKEDLEKELFELRKSVQDTELNKINLFQNTAEARAQIKVIMWLLVTLLHKKNDKGEYSPVFPEVGLDDLEKEAEQKFDKYEELLEGEDNVVQTALRRASYIITMWYMFQNLTTEDLKKFDEENMKELGLVTESNLVTEQASEKVQSSEKVEGA